MVTDERMRKLDPCAECGRTSDCLCRCRARVRAVALEIDAAIDVVESARLLVDLDFSTTMAEGAGYALAQAIERYDDAVRAREGLP